jgi:hypothetical protein
MKCGEWEAVSSDIKTAPTLIKGSEGRYCAYFEEEKDYTFIKNMDGSKNIRTKL